MVHLSSHLLLSDHQYGFRKGHSCALQLIYFIDNWIKTIDGGDRIDMAYFDLATAFDTVPTKGSYCLDPIIQHTWKHTGMADQLPHPPTSESSPRSMVNHLAGAMFSAVFHKEVS